MAECYRVQKSAIHGKGLFARANIVAGAVLGNCATRPVSEAGLHTLTLPDGSLADVVCSLKYINHSKYPNVIYYDDFSVVALRDIAAGEELLHDYGDEWS
ncbi:SET domain-containing protein [Zhongshania arctica]|uniref:SET domain-containing protein n=1 Tax=Zhongshania arctica TaxID=3238302 RepID=A0ABV3TTF2_9GAMM|tara:strand:+ start:4037 stop:4336 length:300 start_codon:yes stop_codon:yes gene_type:complete